MNARFGPGPAVRGTLEPPPDKSISHRAALLGAMSAAPVRVTNYLASADTHSSLDAVRALGARVEERDGALVIDGPGLRGAADGAAIDVGNAGTLLRLLPGWLAGQDGGRWTLDGDASIRRRPVDRVAQPLAAMGAQLDAREGRFTPLAISGRPLHGIEYALPVASAQIKSCVLLAGLLAAGATTVVEPEPSRDHTERLLTAAGAGLTRDGDRITVTPPTEFALEAIHVPGDPSSAAFHVAAAALVPGSRLTVTGMAAQLDPRRVLPHPRADGRGAHRRARDARDRRAGHRAARDARGRPRPADRDTRDRGRGPARDRRAAARRAPGLLRRGRDGRRGRAGAAPQGVRPDRDRGRRPARARRRHRGDGRRLRGARHRRAGGRHDRGPRRPPAGDARRGRRAGEPQRRRGRRDGGRRGQLSGLRRRSGRA